MANDELIKLKIVLDDKGVPVKLESLKKGIKDIDLTTKNAEGAVKKLNAEIANVGLKGGALKSIKVTQSQYSKLAKTQHQLTDSTGSATAATMELTRVISDAPYGIRGMANNITQLVAQMGTATTKAGSFGGALKQMGQSLLGPAGIVLAITTVVSVLDGLYGGMTKAEKTTNDLADSVGKAGVKLQSLKKSINEGNLSREESNKLINAANSEYEDLNLVLDENNQLTKDSVTRIDEKIAALKRLAKANAVMALLEKEYSKLEVARVEKDRVYKERGISDIDEFEKRIQDFEEKRSKTRTRLRSPFSGQEDIARKAFKDFKKESEEINKTIDSLTGSIDVADFFKNKKTKVEALDFIDLYADDQSIQIEIDEQKRRALFNYVDELNNQIELEEVDAEEKKNKRIEEVDDIFRKRHLDRLKSYADKSRKILSSISNFVSAEFEREMTIEQNKTNAKNEQLNARLRNEQLSEDKRKEILNQIAINDEELRKKQEVIAKKKFKAEKAFNISMALINTFSAATGALRDTKGNPIARILGMTAIITAGLAQVATISRQKYQTTASASPSSAVTSTGGSSTSSAEREMNFNIVGNSNSTQLVDAIQSKFDQPLKAYVVSREITSSQALESNIVETASL